MRPWPCLVLVALLIMASATPGILTSVGVEPGGSRTPLTDKNGASASSAEQAPSSSTTGTTEAPPSTLDVLPRAAQISHEGDLIIDDNWIYSVRPGMILYVRGNIIIKDNGVLILDHATLVLNQTYAYEFGIYILDRGSLKAFDSRITSNHPFNITCRDYGSVDADGSRLECAVEARGLSTVSLDNSTAFTVACYGGAIYLWGSVVSLVLVLRGAITGTISVQPGRLGSWSLSANTTITGASFGLIIQNSTITSWSLCVGGTTEIAVQNSTLSGLSCHDSARVIVNQTGFRWASCRGSSVVRLLGCTGGTLACMNSTDVQAVGCDLSVSVILRGASGTLSLSPGHVESLLLEAGVKLNLTDTTVQDWDLGLQDCHDLLITSSVLRGLSCYGSTDVEVRNSTITSIYMCGASRGAVCNSTLGSVACYDSSRLKLFETTCVSPIHVEDEALALVYWRLTVKAVLAGECVRGASISVYFASNSSLATRGFTGPSGLASFLLLGELVNATGEWPVGPYEVVATYGPYEERSLAELPETKQLTLELGFEMEIRCLDGDGEPIEGAVVFVQPGNISARTGPDGWATLDGLLAEDARVQVLVMGVVVAELRLIWGANYTGDVRLSEVRCAVYDLAVRVVDEGGRPIAKALVSLLWLNKTGIMTCLTNSSGWVVFENVPAGSYRIRVAKEGYESTTEFVALREEDQLFIITLKEAVPQAGGPAVPWTILTGVVVGSMIFLIVVAALASTRRKKAKAT